MKNEKANIVVVDYLHKKVYFGKILEEEVWDAENRSPPAIFIKKIEKVRDLLKVLDDLILGEEEKDFSVDVRWWW
jgi:hypothetical protein